MIQQEVADLEVEAMLKSGIIAPSDGPWSSAVVMVLRKKIPKWRFFTDIGP